MHATRTHANDTRDVIRNDAEGEKERGRAGKREGPGRAVRALKIAKETSCSVSHITLESSSFYDTDKSRLVWQERC